MIRNNVRRRDRNGALVGGMLGMLLAGYLQFWCVPFGAAIGSLLGWFAVEIYEICCRSWLKAYVTAAKLHRRIRHALPNGSPDVRAWLSALKAKLGQIGLIGMMSRGMGKAWRGVCICISGIAWLVTWIVSLPAKFWRWLDADAWRKVIVARGFAVATLLVTSAYAWMPMVVHLGVFQTGGYHIDKEAPRLKYEVAPSHPDAMWLQPDVDHAWPAGWAIFVVIFGVVLGICSSAIGEDKEVSRERYRRYTMAGMITLDTVRTLTICVMFGVYGIVVIGSTLLALLAEAIFVLLPFIFLRYAMQGVMKLTMEPRWYLCLGVTTAVTTLTAYLAQPMMLPHTLIWTLAFTAGLISWVITWQARTVVTSFVRSTHLGRQIRIMAQRRGMIRRVWNGTFETCIQPVMSSIDNRLQSVGNRIVPVAMPE